MGLLLFKGCGSSGQAAYLDEGLYLKFAPICNNHPIIAISNPVVQRAGMTEDKNEC